MINVVFFGTPKIAVESLKYLFNSQKINVLAVVTQPDKPKGRGYKLAFSPVKEFAVAKGIPVFQPSSIKKDQDVQKSLMALYPDFFVTVAFGQILSQEVLDIPKYATINLHASLLPKYRGANPIQRAIIEGEKETGVCTMVTELGLDCGDICLKSSIPIPDEMNCVELFELVEKTSPELIEKTLIGLISGEVKPCPQCENGVCIAKKVSKEECKIDWNKSAKEIHNLVRGIYKTPSAYFEFNGKIIKVLKTKVSEGTGKIGEFLKSGKNGLEVGTGEGILVLVTIKPEGKGEMAAKDWYNGVKNK